MVQEEQDQDQATQPVEAGKPDQRLKPLEGAINRAKMDASNLDLMSDEAH